MEIRNVMINLNNNTMAVMDKWGKMLVWDLNKEEFPKWVNLETMQIANCQNNVITYR